MHSYQNKKKRRGFSLVELLVVISIMGILLALGAVSFSGAQKRGRDARRRSDMNAIQKGFEQYFVETGNNTYAACGTMLGSTVQFPAGGPVDPVANSTYTYSGTCASGAFATGYCYCARLEIEDKGNSGASCAFGAAATAKDYFCVTNLQ